MEAYILTLQKLEETRPDDLSPAEWENMLKYQAKHKPWWWNGDGKRAAMAEWYRRRALTRERTGRQEMYDLTLQCYGMGSNWTAPDKVETFMQAAAKDKAQRHANSIMEEYILTQQKLEETRPGNQSLAAWKKSLELQAKHKPWWWNQDGKRAAMAEWYLRRALEWERTAWRDYGMGSNWKHPDEVMDAHILTQQKLEETRPDNQSLAEWEKTLEYQAKLKPLWWNEPGKKHEMVEWYHRRAYEAAIYGDNTQLPRHSSIPNNCANVAEYRRYALCGGAGSFADWTEECNAIKEVRKLWRISEEFRLPLAKYGIGDGKGTPYPSFDQLSHLRGRHRPGCECLQCSHGGMCECVRCTCPRGQSLSIWEGLPRAERVSSLRSSVIGWGTSFDTPCNIRSSTFNGDTFRADTSRVE